MSDLNTSRWLADETTARIVWSRVAEPSDREAMVLRSSLGPLEALAVAVGAAPLPPGFARRLAPTPDKWQVVLDRWRIRLPMCDPRRDLEAIEAVGGHLLVPGDVRWPARLADLGATEPVCLWARGTADLAELVDSSVALVGSRASTRYGEVVAGDLAAGLGVERVSVVSGAAFGIDAAAHRAVLAAEQPTVAVLACGADRTYPAAHNVLLDRIAETGLVVSELPPGAIPTRWRFLERNRIIAGLTNGTVVVEAAWRSGALSTARHAQAINRHVGAVPGPITSPSSAGCHRLIREDQATCITGADDIVEMIRPVNPSAVQASLLPSRSYDGLDPSELRVWESLDVGTGQSQAQISVGAGLGPAEVAGILGKLHGRGRAIYRDPAGDDARRLWWRAEVA